MISRVPLLFAFSLLQRTTNISHPCSAALVSSCNRSPSQTHLTHAGLRVLSATMRASRNCGKTPLCRCDCYGNCEKNPKSVLLCGGQCNFLGKYPPSLLPVIMKLSYCSWQQQQCTSPSCYHSESASFFPAILFLWLLIPPCRMTGRISMAGGYLKQNTLSLRRRYCLIHQGIRFASLIHFWAVHYLF